MSKDKSEGNGTNVNAVVRTFLILQSIANNEEIGLAELARDLHIHKSTVLRFLTTLCDLGYLRRIPENDTYALSLRLFELGATALDKMDVVQLAKPIMKWLASKTNETVHLATREDDSVVYLHKVDSPHVLRMYSRIGKLAPLHCTGLGKALIAWLPESKVRTIFTNKRLRVFTEKTIGKLPDLLKELEKIRTTGFSWDHEEHEPGIRCVAAPVFDASGSVAAAISVSWPSARNQTETEVERGPLVLEASRRLSRALGGTPHSAKPK